MFVYEVMTSSSQRT